MSLNLIIGCMFSGKSTEVIRLINRYRKIYKDKLLLIQSLRFRPNNKKFLSEKIFIPMSIHNYDRFLAEFKKLIINSPANNFPRFSVQNHPAMLNSKKQNLNVHLGL